MASLLLAKALPFVAINSSSGSNVANLITPDPKEVFTAASTGSHHFDVDLGAAYALDTLFAGFFSIAGSYVQEIRTATGLGTGLSAALALAGNPAAMPAATGRRVHAYARLAAPATSRYWRFTVYIPGALTMGILAAGPAIQPLYGREWGSGRLIDDRSAVTPVMGGGYGIERGARVPGLQWTLGDLSDAETESLWNMVDDIGQSAPLVVIEDPDYTAGLQERIHWGLLDRPESYEREMPNRNRWSWRIRGWN